LGFQGFYGHKQIADELSASFARGTNAHGYLFIGPAGCGKKTLARLCAQALLCVRENGEKPCGQCRACKSFIAGTHPDLIEISPEKGKTAISITQIRDLINQHISLRPYEGDKRAVIITGTITPQAQNALLKTLEEPPKGNVIFITGQNTAQFLPTVLSRLRTYNLATADYEASILALTDKGIDRQKAALLSNVTDGNIGKAIELNESSVYWEMRDTALEILRPMDKTELAGLLNKLNGYFENAHMMLDIIETLLTDAQRSKANARIYMTDKQFEIERIAENFSTCDISALLDTVFQGRQRLSGMVNLQSPWQVVSERLLFKIVEVTKGWQK